MVVSAGSRYTNQIELHHTKYRHQLDDSFSDNSQYQLEPLQACVAQHNLE
jgi:hypothetical protein